MFKLIAVATKKSKFNLNADMIPVPTKPLSEQDQIQRKIIQACGKVSRKAMAYSHYPYVNLTLNSWRSRQGILENIEEDLIKIHQDEVIPNLFIGDFASFKAVTRQNPYKISLAIRVNHERFDFEPSADVKVMEIGSNIFDLNSEADWHTLALQLGNVFAAIDEALARNKRVLVSCSMGISRSPTVVIAYLMYRFRLTFKQAYSFLYTKRHISPKDNFVAGLKAYEKRLFLN